MAPLKSGSLSAQLVVLITPNARQSAVVGWQDGVLKIRLAAKPVDGEANTALVTFLANVLGVPKRSVVLTHGQTARTKRLLVEGMDAAAVARVLCPPEEEGLA